MICGWPGPGGERDEPDDNGCDGDCSDCRRDECDERGVDCADPENCIDCAANGWCSAAVDSN